MPKDYYDEVDLFEKEDSLFVTTDNYVVGSYFVPGTDIANGRYLYSTRLEAKTRQPKEKRTNAWKDFEHYRAFRVPDANGPRLQWKSIVVGWSPPVSCTTATSRSRHGLLGFNHLGSPEAPFGEPGFPNSGIPSFYLRDQETDFVPDPVDLSKLKERSLKTMLPEIKAEVSVVNSVLELKDFKTLPATVSKMYTYFTKYRALQKPRDRLRRIGNRDGTLRQALGGGSDGWLQLKFNVLPLLSDISGVHAALSRTQKRINDLVTRSGRTQVSHYTHKYSEYTDTSEETGGQLPWRLGSPGGHPAVPAQGNSIHWKRFVYYEPTIFHAQMRYNYNYTSYQVQNAELLGLLDAFGVNLNPAIIWNAIPWSFAIDWVLGVGRWLDQFKSTNMEPKLNIQDYLWSVKRERRISITGRQANLWGDASNSLGSVILEPTYESSYKRRIGVPPVSLFQTSGLNANEFSLGAALVLARRRPPSRR